MAQYADSLFEVPDFWRPSVLFDTITEKSALFYDDGLHSDAILLHHSDVFGRSSEQCLNLPALESFDNKQLEPPAQLHRPLEQSEGISLPQEEPSDDVWRLIFDETSNPTQTPCVTWEAFQPKDELIRPPRWLSEAGPDAFNAALSRQTAKNSVEAGQPVTQGPLLQSLIALGLGRSSVLFTYQDKSHRVRTNVQNIRATGCSLEASRGLSEGLRSCGVNIRKLKEYIERVYAARESFAGLTAFAHAISIIVECVEAAIWKEAASTASLIQLQSIFARPSQVFEVVTDLTALIATAKSTDELSSILFRRLKESQAEPLWLHDLLQQVLVQSSQPWLELAEEWMGFRSDQGFNFGPQAKSNNFVEYVEGGKNEESGFQLSSQHLPTFITPELGQVLFEAGRSFRLLSEHDPGCSLLKHAATQPIRFEWLFRWKGSDEATHKAAQHTDDSLVQDSEALDAIPHSNQSTKMQPADLDANSDPWSIPKDLQMQPVLSDTESQTLRAIISGILSADTEDALDARHLAPSPDHAAITTFGPTVKARARLINQAAMRMLFHTRSLRRHIDLQRQFHLFGNGNFVQRLTNALFDTDVATTERHLGVMRGGSDTMGLRLGDRNTWPPASSELRLALAGILSDCYNQHLGHDRLKPSQVETRMLPGNLSFAVRHLSEDNARRIIDPTSLYAVDFLRLQYNATSPLNAILTSRSLERYDDIFRFLLRLVRLNFVTLRLPDPLERACVSLRQSLRPPVIHKMSQFKQRASVFMHSCMSYCFDAVIDESWSDFTSYLDKVEAFLQDAEHAHYDSIRDSHIRSVEGIYDVGRRHELCLDQIASGLFLRSKQKEAHAALNEVLKTILTYASFVSEMMQRITPRDPAGQSVSIFDSHEVEIDTCLSQLDRHVLAFIQDCKNLDEKSISGYGASPTHISDGHVTGPNKIDRLLLMLNMNDFYARKEVV